MLTATGMERLKRNCNPKTERHNLSLKLQENFKKKLSQLSNQYVYIHRNSDFTFFPLAFKIVF